MNDIEEYQLLKESEEGLENQMKAMTKTLYINKLFLERVKVGIKIFEKRGIQKRIKASLAKKYNKDDARVDTTSAVTKTTL